MRTRHWMQIAALASTVGLTGTALAADASKTTTQIQNNPTGGPSQGSAVSGAKSVGGSERMDNSNSAGLDTWMNDHAASHNGRVTRQEFLDQMTNRWDTIDAQRRGYLSPDEARGIYMPDQAVRPALSGSDVKPGYMGPGNSKK